MLNILVLLLFFVSNVNAIEQADSKDSFTIKYSTPELCLIVKAGTGPDEILADGFNWVKSFSVDSKGNYFVNDPAGYGIAQYDKNGKFIRKSIYWIVLDREGNFYKPEWGELIVKKPYEKSDQDRIIEKCDPDDKTIYKIVIGKIHRHPEFTPNGIAYFVNPDGKLHVANYDEHVLNTYDQKGKLINTFKITSNLEELFISIAKYRSYAVSQDGKYLYSILYNESKGNVCVIGKFDLNRYFLKGKIKLDLDMTKNYGFLGLDIDNNLYFTNDHYTKDSNVTIPFWVYIFDKDGKKIEEIRLRDISSMEGQEVVKIDIYGNIYQLDLWGDYRIHRWERIREK